MFKNYRNLLKKGGIILGSLLLIILIAMWAVPLFYEKEVNAKIKSIINESIDGELNYSKAKLSFFEHFPSLTASIHDVHLKGAKPYQDSVLLTADHISLGIDLFSLFSSKWTVDQFIVDQGHINLLVDAHGASNYTIYKTDSTKSKPDSGESSNLAFKRIRLINTHFHYADLSVPMLIDARGFNYDGKGDFTSNVFDLHTKAHIDSFSFNFNNEQYLDRKTLSADLITQINTDNLGFVFERNDLKINKLPVRFRGKFAFLPKGYHIDFKLKSQESTLEELLSLVPASYAGWLKDMQVKGTSEVFVNLEGDYIVEQNKNPDLSLGLLINNGYLAYKNTKEPVSDWNTQLRINLPGLNPDSLSIDLKQFEFKLADGFFETKGTIAGFNPLTIHSTVNSKLNLDKLNQAVNWPDYDFAGNWTLKGSVNGTYLEEEREVGLRNEKEKVIASIPLFQIENSLSDGYFKFAALPEPIRKINYHLEAKNNKPELKSVQLSLSKVNIEALQNFIKGHATIHNLEKIDVDAQLQAAVDLKDIKLFYPIDSFDIAGNVKADLIAKGNFDQKRGRFPVTSTHIVMKNGYIKSWAYPIPIEQIEVEAKVKSSAGSLKDLNVSILPVSFSVSGEPFMMKADFHNFDNIKYTIKSKGKLHLEPIYQIFAIDGLNVKGYVKTNVDLAGLQSDALNGNYNKLKNSGKVEIGDIYIESELLPRPVLVNKGLFSFEKEKLKFDNVTARYADNTIVLKGFVDNIVNYLTTSTDILEGKFDFYSPAIKVDDFMAFSAGSEPSSGASAGVVLLPENLNVLVSAKADKVHYADLALQNFTGNLALKSGILTMGETGFELAGLSAKMNGKYQPLTPLKARFDYTIQASDFDIQRAYKEIPIFKEMVTSAKDAYGIVSLDYQLSGLLNQNMEPVMPSLEGKGILTLKDIHFKGFKLLNGISSAAGKDGIKDGSVKEVAIKTSIKNNVMTIERTKMKMAGFRPRFEGQVTLDGQMNLGFRLGLPPFGVLGIPMRITGTSEKFDIKLGKFKEDDLDTEMDAEDKKLYNASQSEGQ